MSKVMSSAQIGSSAGVEGWKQIQDVGNYEQHNFFLLQPRTLDPCVLELSSKLRLAMGEAGL